MEAKTIKEKVEFDSLRGRTISGEYLAATINGRVVLGYFELIKANEFKPEAIYFVASPQHFAAFETEFYLAEVEEFGRVLTPSEINGILECPSTYTINNDPKAIK